MISSFTAIDFETANHSRNSICAVGLVHVVNGKVKHKMELLVQPPENYYHSIHMGIHGITPKHTKSAPSFKQAWPKIEPYIHGQNLVAHNMAFDGDVLTKTLLHYNTKAPSFNKFCTLKIYGAALDVVCYKHDIELEHHNALSDAMACAKLFLMHLKK